MTAKQAAFVEEYLIDLNATQAAIRAGYAPRSAAVHGARLLRNAKVQDALAVAMARRSRRTGISQDRVLRELARIAFLNPADVVDVLDGGVREDAAPEDLAAIQAVRVRRSSSEQGETEEREVRLADKISALRLLGRHLGLDQPAAEEGEPAPFDLPARLIGPAFQPVLLDILDRGHREYVEQGGRGSGKSSFLALVILQLLERYPQLSALVLRKVGETLRDSVYAQLVWAIETLGLSSRYRCRVSPMEITRQGTGQTIYFRGADKPEKIKSIKPKNGYIGIVWFEELDQFHGEEECRNILQSALRGGDLAWVFKSYNPPRTASAWVNKALRTPREGQLIHRSSYLDLPPAWLGRAFLEEAEELRRQNPAAYAHEYGGEVNGAGGQVFQNLTLRPVTEEEASGFDWIYHGVDWGYYPDPWAYNRCYYDAARRRLFLFGELTRLRCGNRETAQALREAGVTGGDYLACDSAEPKSVADYREYGLDAHGVNKGSVRGKGSVAYSIQWLQSLTEIVIDPVRCPDTAREFSEYEYLRDKNGDVISGYPDQNNHHIDAVRYAMAEVWRRGGR